MTQLQTKGQSPAERGGFVSATSLEPLKPSHALIAVNELIRSASTSPPEAEQQGQEGFGESERALPSHPTGAGGFCPSALCASALGSRNLIFHRASHIWKIGKWVFLMEWWPRRGPGGAV